jgi:hypothetical protein
MTKQELGQKMKVKYPQYQNIDDVELADKIIAKYPVYASQITEAPAKPSVGFGKYDLKEAGQDIAQTFGALKTTAKDTAKKIIAPVRAMEAGDQGVLRTFGQSVGAAAGGISRGIGDVFTGAVKTALPQKNEDIIKGNITGLLSTAIPVFQKIDEAVGSPVGTAMKKYESLTPKAKRDVDAVLGIGSLALDIFGAGVGKKTATEVGSQAAKAGAKTADVVKDTAEQAVKFGAKAVEKAEPLYDVTRGLGQNLKNIPSKISTNVVEKQKAVKAIDELPTKVAKTTASRGVDPSDVNVLLQIPADQKSTVKKLYQSVKDFSSGVSKIRPEEIVGKPLTQALKSLESAKNSIGKKLGDVANKLGVVTQEELVMPIFDKLKKVPGLSGLKIENGILNFGDTTLATALTKADRTAIQKIFNEAIKGGTGKQKHENGQRQMVRFFRNHTYSVCCLFIFILSFYLSQSYFMSNWLLQDPF